MSSQEDSYLEYIYNPQTDNVNSPIPILQQQKSVITTNPYITGTIQENETKQKENKSPTFNEINTKLSISIMGLIDDLFIKPNDIPWSNYIVMILEKDQRYTYLCVLLVFTTFFLILLN